MSIHPDVTPEPAPAPPPVDAFFGEERAEAPAHVEINLRRARTENPELLRRLRGL